MEDPSPFKIKTKLQTTTIHLFSSHTTTTEDGGTASRIWLLHASIRPDDSQFQLYRAPTLLQCTASAAVDGLKPAGCIPSRFSQRPLAPLSPEGPETPSSMVETAPPCPPVARCRNRSEERRVGKECPV